MVPTRHEQDNVAELIDQIAKALDPYDLDWNVLFVDDSDDETPDVIRRLAAEDPEGRIGLIHRSPAERESAMAGAIALGIERTRADVVAVLDADLQHPPGVLPWMVAPLLTGRADICIPSRFLYGGSARGLERRWRRIASRGSGVVLQAVFPEARQITDPGGGLFALRREVVAGAALRPIGFKPLAEVVVRGRWSTFCEFPYVFEQRADGTSPARLRYGLTLGRHVWRLWFDTRVAERRPRVARRRVAPVDPTVIARDASLRPDVPSHRPIDSAPR